jgi:hypothetical protein
MRETETGYKYGAERRFNKKINCISAEISEASIPGSESHLILCSNLW